MIVERQSALRQTFVPLSLSLAIFLLLISVDSVWALDANQPINSYIRTRLTDQDGESPTLVDDLVQSHDGFLWLRSGTALVRFDGRHFTRFEGLGRIFMLALAPDGDLWIGTTEDLKQIPATALNQFGRLPSVSYHFGPGPGKDITALHFTRDGVLWVGTTAGLYRLEHGALLLAISGAKVERIEEAANGHLWISTTAGPIEWDGSRAVPHPELEAQLGVKTDDIFHVFEDSHGVTWFCTRNGVARRIGGTIQKLAPWGPKGHPAFRVYEDSNGRVWFGKAEGLFQATATGLELVVAGMRVRSIYGDRDGNLWVGTNGDGLYRLKDRAVRMFTTADGLPNNLAMTVLVTHDGAVWSGFNCGGLSRFDGHGFRTYKEKDGLLNSCVWSLAEDANHDLWIGTWGGGVFRLHEGSFTQYSKAQGLSSDDVPIIVAARDGSIWTAGPGVSRIRDGNIRRYTPTLDGLPRHVDGLLADRAGGIWVYGPQGTYRLTADRFVISPFLPKVETALLGEDRSGVLYCRLISKGIFRIENDQAIQVGPDLEVRELLETEQGDLWLTGGSIFRVPHGGLDLPHQPDEPVNFEPFGPNDGLATSQSSSGGYRSSALAPDGKLWIATNQGLAMLDLSRLPRTDREPDIYVEGITVGRNQQLPGHELVLPAGTHHVELNFDAIEIGYPEKIGLQYRLDGVDSEWLDADPPGHAIYSTLPPGRHAFHVRACNRSGIWDRAGMVYYITQQPYFYQTRWFLAATIAFGLFVIAGLYQLRLRQLVARLNLRLEERVAERTRIARELHDTLLQTFSALLLRLQSVSKVLPARPEEAKQRVDTAIDQASNAIAEGRDAVQQLRAGGPTTVDLAQSISSFVSELASSLIGENPPQFRVQVEGTPRSVNPMVHDEVYRIAVEALRNAMRYSGARQIEVDIRYDEHQLRLRVRDDGKGMDPGVLEHGQAPGHWGLHGMRERAKLVGGTLEVWSMPGSGTELELAVPAVSAYARPAPRWPIFGRRWRRPQL